MEFSREYNYWEFLFAVAPAGLIFIDQHAVVKLINLEALSLLGFNQSDKVDGRELGEVMPSWKETSFYVSLPSLLGGQSTFESIDFDMPGPENKHLKVSAVHVPARDGHAKGVLFSVNESTQVAHLERRLHRAEYQASIGKIARGIAHELNSPLDGILRYAHLALSQLPEDSHIREYLIHIGEGLDRMVRAVKAFLEFSRQVTTPVNRVADVHHLIEDVLILVRHRAKFQQVEIVKNFESDLPLVMDAGLQHAIANIVKNGFDVMPKGGTLTITTKKCKTDHVDIDIEDTGPGIPEEIRSRIFEPFFSTKAIHQGNGLGLVISKEAVERSGGTIEFTSQSGAGTKFRIHVPVSNIQVENGQSKGKHSSC